MKASSRTTSVVLGGIGGGLVGGPGGAVAGGITGGASCDGLITWIDYRVHGEVRLHGVLG
jgi:hypothetical protein